MAQPTKAQREEAVKFWKRKRKLPELNIEEAMTKSGLPQGVLTDAYHAVWGPALEHKQKEEAKTLQKVDPVKPTIKAILHKKVSPPSKTTPDPINEPKQPPVEVIPSSTDTTTEPEKRRRMSTKNVPEYFVALMKSMGRLKSSDMDAFPVKTMYNAKIKTGDIPISIAVICEGTLESEHPIGISFKFITDGELSKFLEEYTIINERPRYPVVVKTRLLHNHAIRKKVYDY